MEKLSGQLQKVQDAMDVLSGRGSAGTPVLCFWRGCGWFPVGGPRPVEVPGSPLPERLPAHPTPCPSGTSFNTTSSRRPSQTPWLKQVSLFCHCSHHFLGSDQCNYVCFLSFPLTWALQSEYDGCYGPLVAIEYWKREMHC